MKNLYLNSKGKLFNLLIFVLASVIILGAAQSCAPSNSNSNPNSNEDGGQSGAAENDGDNDETQETAADGPRDSVPEMNFNGESVNILHRDYGIWAAEMYAEAQNSETINDAVYKRNLAIEERFNVTLNMTAIPGAWAQKDQFLNIVRNSVSAGDDEYEIICGYAAYIVELTSGGYLNNWKDIQYVDLTKPWWNQDFVSEMTVNGKLFFLTGDLALSTINAANVLLFNKVMWQSYGLENPYDIVKSGDWTLDRMAEITKQVSKDLDNNGKYDENDLYGYALDTGNQVDAYVVSWNIPVTAKGDDGFPKYVIEDGKFYDAFFKLYEFTRETVSTFTGSTQPVDVDVYSAYRPMFQNQQVLILAEYLGNSAELRDYEFDFGILPYPKLDGSQEKYKSMPQNGYTMFCVPVTVKNTDKVGAVIEAMAAESRESVVPAFYEVALKTKYARDDESAEMIDIIRDGLSYNFGAEYVVPLGHPHLQWRFLIDAKKNNIVSEVERNMKVFETNLEKILAAYE